MYREVALEKGEKSRQAGSKLANNDRLPKSMLGFNTAGDLEIHRNKS